MSELQGRERRGLEGRWKKATVEKHLAEAPFRTFRSQLKDYYSFREQPRERISINRALSTLQAKGKKFGLTFHEPATFLEQRHVIHALAEARDIAHTHDSAPKLLSQINEIEASLEAKDLSAEIMKVRKNQIDTMRGYVLSTINPVEKKLIEWALEASEKLIEQAKQEKKMGLVADLQIRLASFLLAKEFYVITMMQFSGLREEIGRVAERLSFDEVLRESKRKAA